MVIRLTEENFEKEVLNAEEPFLVEFWSVRCPHCKSIALLIERISEERAGLLVGKLNVDESPNVSARFGIMSLPTLILFRGGNPTKSAVGELTRKELLAFIESN